MVRDLLMGILSYWLVLVLVWASEFLHTLFASNLVRQKLFCSFCEQLFSTSHIHRYRSISASYYVFLLLNILCNLRCRLSCCKLLTKLIGQNGIEAFQHHRCITLRLKYSFCELDKRALTQVLSAIPNQKSNKLLTD